ncbi:MAG: hypothetical protein KC492_20855 [Myxococcales bacterium]|nr:hypothetical protein [Myxococcales bacterium]MCB9606751.1 hypothetical protein [Polyangiaceae bacterium]
MGGSGWRLGCVALVLWATACGGARAKPAPTATIEVGDGDPEPASPAEPSQGNFQQQLLKAVRDALLDETYGTPGDPDRFLNAYLWSLYVPRTAAVHEYHRYNPRFLEVTRPSSMTTPVRGWPTDCMRRPATQSSC